MKKWISCSLLLIILCGCSMAPKPVEPLPQQFEVEARRCVTLMRSPMIDIHADISCQITVNIK